MLQKPNRQRINGSASEKGCFASIAAVTVLVVLGIEPRAFAQAPQCPYVTCGDGSDGVYNPSASGYFMPGGFHGTGVANNVFNFTSVTIPSGVTITLTSGYDNAPVYWLVQGNVDIEGTVSLAGANGAYATSDVDQRLPALAGSGGYNGGVGGNLATGQPDTAGYGPGGGAAGDTSGHCTNADGSFTGNQYLIPLIGGSGGGGTYGGTSFGASGGAGGGAILIATSGTITVNGTLTANGGNSYCTGSAGSGGASRLVSNTITGGSKAVLTAIGGCGQGIGATCGGPGRVRLEAITQPISFAGSFNGTPVSGSSPQSNFNGNIPGVPQPSVQVTSINGQPITENPFSFPDIQINTDQPVNVVITGNQVPVGTIPTLVILGETADQDLSCTGGLQQGSLPAGQTSCTIPIMFNYGGSRGLVKTTWQNPGSTVLPQK